LPRNLRQKLRDIFPTNDENRKICKILRSLNKNISILDVGCGYGDKMELLNRIGFNNILGVDINRKIVKKDLEKGLNVMHVDDFWNCMADKQFDLIIMSHIVEHFNWSDLIDFLDKYLDKLRIGGYLLIITPTFNKLFFEDFDHVKPYYPGAFRQLFSGPEIQFQRPLKQRMKLENIYFRRSQIYTLFFRHIYLSDMSTVRRMVALFIYRVLRVLFTLSFGLLGRTTGWIGLYKKEGCWTDS
jgi:SAM-dependent methyltransferase